MTTEESIEWLRATVAIGETHLAEVMLTHPKDRLYVWDGREGVGREEYIQGLNNSIEHGKSLLRKLAPPQPLTDAPLRKDRG